MIFARADFINVHDRLQIQWWMRLTQERRSATTAKGSPRSRLRLVSPWCSFHEVELRTFYYYPSYCLSPGGSSAVCTMTICTDAHLRRRAETHLATITATGNFILFHACHRTLGIVRSTPRRFLRALTS